MRDSANDRFIYFGGYNEQLLTDLWLLDARGGRIRTLAEPAGSSR